GLRGGLRHARAVLPEAARRDPVTSAHFLETALRRALDDQSLRVTAMEPVSGGCIHETARLATTKGEFFAKWSSECPAELFQSEAEALRALRAAGSTLAVPEVILASAPSEDCPAFIVMEYLAPSQGRAGQEQDALGRGLAEVHRRSADGFGFTVTTYCGSTPQENTWTSSWSEFYAERRLGALIPLLRHEGRIGPREETVLERLAERLPALLAPAPTPSLIHGDLWSGNVLHTAQGPALVDPACAYADREMEFGITTLFGGLSARAFAAYEETWPLPP